MKEMRKVGKGRAKVGMEKLQYVATFSLMKDVAKARNVDLFTTWTTKNDAGIVAASHTLPTTAIVYQRKMVDEQSSLCRRLRRRTKPQ